VWGMEEVEEMVERVALVIWKTVACMTIVKQDRRAFDDLPPVEQRLLIFLNEFTHPTASIECARENHHEKKIVMVIGQTCNVEDSVQINCPQGEFATDRIRTDFF
jgi:hypothetical protein